MVLDQSLVVEVLFSCSVRLILYYRGTVLSGCGVRLARLVSYYRGTFLLWCQHRSYYRRTVVRLLPYSRTIFLLWCQTSVILQRNRTVTDTRTRHYVRPLSYYIGTFLLWCQTNVIFTDLDTRGTVLLWCQTSVTLQRNCPVRVSLTLQQDTVTVRLVSYYIGTLWCQTNDILYRYCFVMVSGWCHILQLPVNYGVSLMSICRGTGLLWCRINVIIISFHCGYLWCQTGVMLWKDCSGVG